MSFGHFRHLTLDNAARHDHNVPTAAYTPIGVRTGRRCAARGPVSTTGLIHRQWASGGRRTGREWCRRDV